MGKLGFSDWLRTLKKYLKFLAMPSIMTELAITLSPLNNINLLKKIL